MPTSIPTLVDIKEGACEKIGEARESLREFSLKGCMERCRNSNRMIVFIVFIAIFIDNMLMTTVGKWSGASGTCASPIR